MKSFSCILHEIYRLLYLIFGMRPFLLWLRRSQRILRVWDSIRRLAHCHDWNLLVCDSFYSGWMDFDALELVSKIITRVNNRVLVGLPPCMCNCWFAFNSCSSWFNFLLRLYIYVKRRVSTNPSSTFVRLDCLVRIHISIFFQFRHSYVNKILFLCRRRSRRLLLRLVADHQKRDVGPEQGHPPSLIPRFECSFF